MQKEPFVLAYDLGTGGVKAAIVDPKGCVLRTSTVDYPLYTPGPNMAEQDAEDYWQGLVRATHAVFQHEDFDPAGCIGLAIGAMWRGIIPVGQNGAPLSRGMIWLDTRARDEAEELKRIFPGSSFAPNEYWPKMLWLRRHCPDLVSEADQFLEANAFLKRRLTGTATSDPSNCYTDSFDPLLASFYGQVREYCGIPESRFPALVHSDDRAGTLLPEAADKLGLTAGIPVFGGSGDIPAIAIGSGSSGIGSVHLYLGSSGWVGYSAAHKSGEQHGSGFDELINVIKRNSGHIGSHIVSEMKYFLFYRGRFWECCLAVRRLSPLSHVRNYVIGYNFGTNEIFTFSYYFDEMCRKNWMFEHCMG